MIFKDLFGTTISLGDIIAVPLSWSSELKIAKVTKISNRAVSFTIFNGKQDPAYPKRPWWRLPLTPKDLLEEPTGWKGWRSKDVANKLLVLRKANSLDNKLTFKL